MCLFAHLNWGCKSRGAADTADRTHTDQCECLRPTPGGAKENSIGWGVGRQQAVHTPFDQPIAQGYTLDPEENGPN